MQRIVLSGVLFAATVATTTLPARAHVTLENQRATVGASYKATLRVPHGCDGSATVKVSVQIPEGMIGVKPMPKAGWDVQVTTGPYAKPYSLHGREVTEGAKQLTWTGKLADGHYDEFVAAGFLARDLPVDQRMYFPVTQECEQGAARWVEIPAAGQDPHALKFPAPGVMLVARQQAAAAPAAAANTYRLGPLTIEAPWSRATPSGAKVAGGYLKVTNSGTAPDRLTGGNFALASRVEVHEMATTEGVMRMRQLPAGVEIKPGETVELKPGGMHMMFMNLKQGLKAGENQKITLTFEKAGAIEVEFRVAPIGAPGPDASAPTKAPGAGHGGGDHSHH